MFQYEALLEVRSVLEHLLTRTEPEGIPGGIFPDPVSLLLKVALGISEVDFCHSDISITGTA